MDIMRITFDAHEIIVPILPGDVSEKIWSALQNGTYEAKEAFWVKRAVRPGDRILELGTGLGIIASVMAATDDVRILAFDANPEVVALARRVIDTNGFDNVTISHGLLMAGKPREVPFYLRKDFWMSSTFADQGPYEHVITIRSVEIDEIIAAAGITILVMDIEGGEYELLRGAQLPGVERVFLELHDHLYGLDGVMQIIAAMAANGFAFDPRGSSGACALFTRDLTPRAFDDAFALASV
ncbi:FkbM family methyltransferase [Phyllobacterium sp. UNC302MFCol5.2]|uniref:FkbM family methyltransferase n=1 Tax=Phyllobacterium sp. UNC302MFCol5.2 TaxID=1449065 RepID=UPI000483BBC1|nr:FkbM family methyltransferase [Phyllobacterium sp. UNC302MFCol5.2]